MSEPIYDSRNSGELSPTPRTDGEIEHASNVALYLDCNDTKKWNHGPAVVRAQFARDLEIELNEAKAALANSISQDDLLYHLKKRGYEVDGLDGDESPAVILTSWLHGQISEAKDQILTLKRDKELALKVTTPQTLDYLAAKNG